jgi:hypothetical protein
MHGRANACLDLDRTTSDGGRFHTPEAMERRGLAALVLADRRSTFALAPPKKADQTVAFAGGR